MRRIWKLKNCARVRRAIVLNRRSSDFEARNFLKRSVGYGVMKNRKGRVSSLIEKEGGEFESVILNRRVRNQSCLNVLECWVASG